VPGESDEVVEVDPPTQLEVSLLASSLFQVLIDTPMEPKKSAEPKKPGVEEAFGAQEACRAEEA